MSTNTSPKVLLSPQEGNVDEWARETGAELIRAGVFQLQRLPSASEEELAKLDLSARMKWDEMVHRHSVALGKRYMIVYDSLSPLAKAQVPVSISSSADGLGLWEWAKKEYAAGGLVALAKEAKIIFHTQMESGADLNAHLALMQAAYAKVVAMGKAD